MLKDMKRPKVRQNVLKAETPMSDHEQYPYGLRLTLEEQELGKLGLSVKGLDVNENLSIKAVAKVSGLEDRSFEDGRKRQSVSLIITKLDVDRPKSKTMSYFDKQKEGPK